MTLKDIEELALAINETEYSVAFGGSFSLIRQGVQLGRTPHDLDIFVISPTQQKIDAVVMALYAHGFHAINNPDLSYADNLIVLDNGDGFKVKVYEAPPGTIYEDDKTLGMEIDFWLYKPLQLISLYDTLKWKASYIVEGNEARAKKCTKDIELILKHLEEMRGQRMLNPLSV